MSYDTVICHYGIVWVSAAMWKKPDVHTPFGKNTI